MACKEPIKQDARKCPHCHQIQSGAYALQTNPLFGLAIGALVVSILAWLIYSIGSDASMASSSPQIEIGSGVLHTRSGSDQEPLASCFANLKNSGLRYVSDPSLQAEFFDASGKVIDVHYTKHKFSLMPSIAAQGRVTGTPSADVKTYASCKISLLSIR